MQMTVMDIRRMPNGALLVAVQCECGYGTGEVTNTTYTFEGSEDISPWDDLRTWLAVVSETAAHNEVAPQGIPADIADLIGKPVDTSELRQRYKPQLDNYKHRMMQARQQNEAQRKR